MLKSIYDAHRGKIGYRTLRKLKEVLDGNVHSPRSDNSFRSRLPLYPSRIPIARKGNEINSVDVSPGQLTRQSSHRIVFGHFKDDVDFKQATSLDELKDLVDEYMKYYNGTRKQWNLKKDDSGQYRSHLIGV